MALKLVNLYIYFEIQQPPLEEHPPGYSGCRSQIVGKWAAWFELSKCFSFRFFKEIFFYELCSINAKPASLKQQI